MDIKYVRCPNCGEEYEWDETEELFETCDNCGYELTVEVDGEKKWKLNVEIFDYSL